MGGSKKTIVSTQEEFGAVMKSAASHYKQSRIQQYKESRCSINDHTRPNQRAEMFVSYTGNKTKKRTRNCQCFQKMCRSNAIAQYKMSKKRYPTNQQDK